MKKDSFIKKYIWHILNILCILCLGLPFVILLFNDGEASTPFIISMLLMGLVIIFTFFEIIYFIVKVATNKEINNKALKCILIYLFNYIYIPYVYVKYLYDGEKKKNDGVIYLIVSIILYVLLSIFIFAGSFYLEFYNSNSNNHSENVLSDETYTQIVEDINITLPKNYKIIDSSSYDILFNNNGKSSIGIQFFKNLNETLEEHIQAYDNNVVNVFENLKLIDSDKFNDNTKEILTHTYEFTSDGDQMIENYSIIKFNEKDNYFVVVIHMCYENEYDKTYKDAINKIVKSIDLNK